MTRFAWLQIRSATLITFAAILALAAVSTITGIQLAHLYSTSIAHCKIACGLAGDQFTSHQGFLQRAFDLLSRLAPVLLGVFWGAPLLARELETGTFRLAWTQSVTRTRWLATKLAVGVTVTAVASGLLTLTITWWSRSLDHVSTNQYALFDRRDIVPIGYAVFAFASGALIGALIRRTVPAMATTMVVFVLARVATTLWVRPHLLAPRHTIVALTDPQHLGLFLRDGTFTVAPHGAGPANAWTLSTQLVDSSGHAVHAAGLSAFAHASCPALFQPQTGLGPPASLQTCQAHIERAFSLMVTYQPPNHYWPLQGIETGIFLALALACAGGCFWLIGRRA